MKEPRRRSRQERHEGKFFVESSSTLPASRFGNLRGYRSIRLLVGSYQGTLEFRVSKRLRLRIVTLQQLIATKYVEEPRNVPCHIRCKEMVILTARLPMCHYIMRGSVSLPFVCVMPIIRSGCRSGQFVAVVVAKLLVSVIERQANARVLVQGTVQYLRSHRRRSSMPTFTIWEMRSSVSDRSIPSSEAIFRHPIDGLD